MENFDPYIVLDVPRDATPDQIKAAYRSGIRRLHPDVGGGREDYDRFVRAYDVLKDAKLRADYDRTGRVGERDVNPLDQHARVAIARQLRMILQIDEDPYTGDLVQAIIMMMEAEQEQLEAVRLTTIRARDRAERLPRKFKRKHGTGSNLFAQLLSYEQKLAGEHIAAIEHDLKVRARAIEILRDYEFDYDRMLSFFGTSAVSASWR